VHGDEATPNYPAEDATERIPPSFRRSQTAATRLQLALRNHSRAGSCHYSNCAKWFV